MSGDGRLARNLFTTWMDLELDRHRRAMRKSLHISAGCQWKSCYLSIEGTSSSFSISHQCTTIKWGMLMMRFTEKECLLSSSLSPYKNNNTKSGHWKCPVRIILLFKRDRLARHWMMMMVVVVRSETTSYKKTEENGKNKFKVIVVISYRWLTWI